MELRILLLGVILGILAVTKPGSCKSESVVLEGSGALDTSDVDSENDDDIYMSGSGVEPTENPSENKNRQCRIAECWCVYDDGSEVPNTRSYGRKPDCSSYGERPTTAVPTIPTRPRDVTETETMNPLPETTPSDRNRYCSIWQCYCMYNDGTKVEGTETYTGKPDCSQYGDRPVTEPSTALPIMEASQPRVVPEIKEEIEDLDIEFIDATTRRFRPGFAAHTASPKQNVEQTTMNNKITAGKATTPKSKADEKLEEHNNLISNTGYLKNDRDVEREAIESNKPHPGILAALIGGGVVGLLCAILLILFIIYRMRKKDEGSYPLDDGKPLKNYAYSKAPSREFYA